MTDRELKALIKAKYNIVSTADEDLLSEIAKTQRSIYARIKALALGLPQSGGRFIWDRKATQINQITKTVFDAIRNSTYRNKVDGYLRKFDVIEGMNKTIVGETSGISAKTLKSLDLSDEKKAAIDAIAKRLTSPASIESNIIQPISQILYKHARFSATVDEAVAALKEFIVKTDASDGIISRYVGQVSRDAINGYNGTLYQVMQREYDLNAYRYIGGLVKDSRPQCQRWINHNEGVLTREFLEPELQEASDLILSGGKSPRFKGYSKYTVPLNWDSFAIIRGGHNCIHEAIPFKLGSENKEVFDDVADEQNVQQETEEARERIVVPDTTPNIESKARELREVAKKTGPEIDEMANTIADKHGARVTPLNYKSQESIIRKATSEYNGDVSKVTDSVRNTIIADREALASIAADLKANPLTTRVKYQDFVDSGYRGYLANVQTSEGILGEIQVNTPRMIYAKEPPSSARQIIGNDVWESIRRETGLEGGLGHKFYEQYRLLDIADPRRLDILKLSREYYANFYD